MLDWLTFAAALLAAVGAFLGPFVAYRASIRTIQAEQQIETSRSRSQSVDKLIEQATGSNPTSSTYALSQLDYLLASGQLTLEQATAVRNAIAAVMADDGGAGRRRGAAMSDEATVSSPDVARARLLVRLDETLGTPTPDHVARIAGARPAPALPPATDEADPLG